MQAKSAILKNGSNAKNRQCDNNHNKKMTHNTREGREATAATMTTEKI